MHSHTTTFHPVPVDPSAAGRTRGDRFEGVNSGFTENRGQVADSDGRLRPEILYTANVGGAHLYFRRDGMYTVFSRSVDVASVSEATGHDDNPTHGEAALELHPREYCRVDMHLVGANADVVVQAVGELPGYSNFYLAHCPAGITNVSRTAKLVYHNVYDGIDLVYHSASHGRIKYEFVVHPGADPSVIRMRYDGASVLPLTSGGICITTPTGTVEESKPDVFQDGLPVQGCTTIVSDGDVTFALGAYNPEKVLVIDPWSTYFGGSDDENVSGNCISSDNSGNMLLAGSTYSSNLPILNGIQTSKAGVGDVCVAKFDTYGWLNWSTYFGGSSDDNSNSVTTDGSGNPYVFGWTASSNFPLLYPAQNSGPNFIFKLNTGGVLEWSTCFGNGSSVNGSGIAVSASGAVAIFGYTSSATMPVPRAHQATMAGASDGYLALFDFTASLTLRWATYLGGALTEEGYDVAFDGNENLIVAGMTMSTDFPVLNSYQYTLRGNRDGLLAKFDSSGNLLWSTYYGGDASDFFKSIVVDQSGAMYVTGGGSGTFPVVNAYQSSNGGLLDAVIVKLNSSGVPQWSTFYGGSADETAEAITLDPQGNILVAGRTGSGNFPVLNPMQQQLLGKEDAFALKLGASGTPFWSTFFGGGISGYAFTLAKGIASGANGEVCIAGTTTSGSLMMVNAYQSVKSGVRDFFLVSLTGSGAIPVELSAFAARIIGNGVRLTWTTETETGNVGFDVQRSSNPSEGGWESLGFVAGFGTSTARHDYAFTDDMPATGLAEQSIYYRLKQVDTDGSIRFSEIVEALLGAAPDGFAIAEIYPQPADGVLTVRFASPVADATIRIVDVLGQTVAEHRSTTSSTVLLDVASLQPGMYCLLATRGDATAVGRFIIR